MPTPFKVDIPLKITEAIIERVSTANVPIAPEGSGWAYGMDGVYLKRFQNYWVNEFNWKRSEVLLNLFPQFIAPVTVGDTTLNLHFYHLESPRADATPLILSHGWPGSVFEFLRLIEPLTNPPADEPAFHVVVPSLPGYGFSQSYGGPTNPRRIAAYFASLMTDVLGYDSFLAQGGDWGGIITSWMAADYDACKAIHININGWGAPGVGPETEEEKAFAASIDPLWMSAGAYFNTQAQRPFALAPALADSPMGWAAWVLDKFYEWSDVKDGDLSSTYTMDHLITNIMIYLVTDTVASSLWPYVGIFADSFGEPLAEGTRIEKPTAIAKLPYEVPLYSFPPRSQVERSFNVVQWTEYKAGGHFAAMEQPDAFLADVREWAKKLG